MPDEEKILIQKAKAGDTDSFELLIQRCKTKAFNIALRYLQNEEDAMDALQDSFIKIFRSLHQFKEESSFDTWVYRIVINTCNDMSRKNKKYNGNVSLFGKDEEQHEQDFEIPDFTNSPEVILEKQETLTLVMTSLARLPQEQQEAVVLRDVQGFSYDEIAAILHCSSGTIKSRISRGRISLRKLILEAGNL
jgi:RNA polymerase sigma factor (sigma-70 family)